MRTILEFIVRIVALIVLVIIFAAIFWYAFRDVVYCLSGGC